MACVNVCGLERNRYTRRMVGKTGLPDSQGRVEVVRLSQERWCFQWPPDITIKFSKSLSDPKSQSFYSVSYMHKNRGSRIKKKDLFTSI